eukprot:3169911-Pyramimonas_sp.AAC.1
MKGPILSSRSDFSEGPTAMKINGLCATAAPPLHRYSKRARGATLTSAELERRRAKPFRLAADRPSLNPRKRKLRGFTHLASACREWPPQRPGAIAGAMASPTRAFDLQPLWAITSGEFLGMQA